MPLVAVLDGIKIQFYWDEHPPPHFHVEYGEHVAVIENHRPGGAVPDREGLVASGGTQFRLEASQEAMASAQADDVLHHVPEQLLDVGKMS